MDFSLQQNHRHFLIGAIALSSIALFSLPAFASDLRPAPHHIEISQSAKNKASTPNIITGQSHKTNRRAPLPKQKPEQIETRMSKEETSRNRSVIKTLKFRGGETKKIKTTKEIIPLAEAPAPTTTATQKPDHHNVALPTSTPDYYVEARQNNSAQTTMPERPFANTAKSKGLADSLRAYMKAQKRDPALIDALYSSTQETGVSFELLTIKAMIESNLGQSTIASQSSARGIFQYIDATWLSLIKRHGKKAGYSSYVKALKYDPIAKRYDVNEGSNISRQEVLDLRNNAQIASLIKAYQVIDEQAVLKEFKEGQSPTVTDHYIIHMMGIPLSRIFYRLKNSHSPIIPAHLKNGMFNQAIALNPTFFYDDHKNALNAPQIYEHFAKTTAKKIDALRALDKRYGSGDNVTAQSYAPTPIKPRIHTPSADSFHNAATDSTLDKIEPASGTRRIKEKPKPQRISALDLLKHEPTPYNRAIGSAQ